MLAAICCLFCAIASGAQDAPPAPSGVTAASHDSRIDLRWTPVTQGGARGYHIYRADAPGGPYAKINHAPHQLPVYSDFLGANGKTHHYRVTTDGLAESAPSATVSATSRAMTDDQLLTSVQEATFRYFWDAAHPVSGLARESVGLGHGAHVTTIGGTGFGLMALVVGAERGFAARPAAAARTRKMLRFLEEKASRYHGAWSHWLNGATGQTIRFGRDDDGGDLVETALLIQGILTARQYFKRDDAVESEIRARATRLWREVEWDWYRQKPGSDILYWHWSPNHGWKKNMWVRGWNEAMIVYLLAIASPTHPMPPSAYYKGWAGGEHYANGKSYYGIKQPLGRKMGGPLFFTHYSFLGFDPRGKRDRFANYFEHGRNVALIHRAYAIDNPKKHVGYGADMWGLTASVNPRGYSAHSPTNDNGTVAPTAAISSMPYTPKESLAALKNYYHNYGDRLWGHLGFKDAFNLNANGQEWFARGYLALDQGPILIMLENHRSALCWNTFMSNPEIQPTLKRLGWTID